MFVMLFYFSCSLLTFLPQNLPKQISFKTSVQISCIYLSAMNVISMLSCLDKRDLQSLNYILRHKLSIKKSRILETKNLSTDADSRSDTILERLRDLSHFDYFNFF